MLHYILLDKPKNKIVLKAELYMSKDQALKKMFSPRLKKLTNQVYTTKVKNKMM